MSEPFSQAPGVNGYNPSVVGGSGTTCKIFPNLLANSTGLPAGFGVGSPAPALPLPVAAVTIPGTGQFEQQQISVAASGYLYVHGTSPTINFLFQQGQSLTYNASGQNTMATLASNQALTTADYYPWSFSMKMQGDAVSGILQTFSGVFACNGVAGTVTLTDLTSVNLTTTSYNFVIGISFQVTDALNKAFLSQFSLTQS